MEKSEGRVNLAKKISLKDIREMETKHMENLIITIFKDLSDDENLIRFYETMRIDVSEDVRRLAYESVIQALNDSYMEAVEEIEADLKAGKKLKPRKINKKKKKKRKFILK